MNSGVEGSRVVLVTSGIANPPPVAPAIAMSVGDLARIIGCSATASIPVLKSPRQTIQVSGIRRPYLAGFIRRWEVLVVEEQGEVWWWWVGASMMIESFLDERRDDGSIHGQAH